jgi:membrane protein YqaA with SNARE-associated domain
MFEWTVGGGLAALFAAAFVSATLLPASSEVVLLAFILAHPQSTALAVLVATVGNTLGSLTTYGLGRLVPRRSRPPSARALGWVRRHGAWALALAWLPLVGDALCLAAGWLRVPLGRATLAITCGKLARYIAVAVFAGAVP